MRANGSKKATDLSQDYVVPTKRASKKMIHKALRDQETENAVHTNPDVSPRVNNKRSSNDQKLATYEMASDLI